MEKPGGFDFANMKKVGFGVDSSGDEHSLPGEIFSFLLIIERIDDSAVIFLKNEFSCPARNLAGECAHIEMQFALQEFWNVLRSSVWMIDDHQNCSDHGQSGGE